MTKHRPYLTTPQIELILSILPDTPAGREIHKNLSTLILRVSVGLSQGSYNPTPRASLSARLGFSDEQEYRYLNDLMTPEEELSYQDTLLKKGA